MSPLTVGKLKEILAAFEVPDEALVEAYEGESNGLILSRGSRQFLFIDTKTGKAE